MLHRGKLILRSSLFASLLTGRLGAALLVAPGIAAECRVPARGLLARAQRRRFLPALIDAIHRAIGRT